MHSETQTFSKKRATAILFSLSLLLFLFASFLFFFVFLKSGNATSPMFSQRFATVFVVSTLGLLGIFGICVHRFLEKKEAALYGSLYFFILAVTFHLGLLFVLFSSEGTLDLRTYFTTGALQDSPGCNLNYGLHMASSILQGKGPLIGDTIPWCRMPGYGYIIALSGNAFDLLQMAINAVLLQIFLFSSALAFFFWTLLRITKPWIGALIATVIAFMPQYFFQIQIESFMPIVILFSLAAATLYASQEGKISFRYHLLLHSSFALWFFLRTDVLPAWGIVSLILYGREIKSWKYLCIPAFFVVAISLPWALFKLPRIGEFSMTTESVGFSLMGGLWEVPSQFIWEPTDKSVYDWLFSQNMRATTKSSSQFAAKESLRFCLTFPIYTLSLIWHKFLFFAKSPLTKLVPIYWTKLLCAAILLMALLSRYQSQLILLWGWPIFFNVPVFFIFYSSEGRFYHAPTICLIAASILLLLDKDFYRNLAAYRYRTASMALAIGAVVLLGPSLDHYLIQHPSLRYYAPFLDPKLSTLNVLKEP